MRCSRLSAVVIGTWFERTHRNQVHDGGQAFIDSASWFHTQASHHRGVHHRALAVELPPAWVEQPWKQVREQLLLAGERAYLIGLLRACGGIEPREIDAVRTEMHDGFSAIRAEMREGFAAISEEFSAVRLELRSGDEETRRYMRVLFEEYVGHRRLSMSELASYQ